MKTIIDELIYQIKDYEKTFKRLPRRIRVPVFRKKEIGTYSQIRIATLPPITTSTSLNVTEQEFTEFNEHTVFIQYHDRWYIEIS